MKKLFKKKFSLTDKGAGDLIKSSLSSFFVYVVNMLPAILVLFVLDQLVLGNVRGTAFYVIFSIVTLVIMFLLLRVDYDTLYNSTYRESANMRMDIADILSKLPLSYFSRHDLSDLSQTIMSDVERIEHAMSHAMAKTIGFFLFMPIVAILLLIGNVKLGLAVVVPIAISLLLIFLSKRMQVSVTTKYFDRLRENSEVFQESIELQQEIKSYGMAGKIKKSLYQRMDDSEKMHLKGELTQALPLLFGGMITQISLGIVILAGAFLYQAGDINLLYLIGYILISIKIKEAIDGVSENIAELFYLDARFKRIGEMRNAQLQEGEDRNIANYDIALENVSFSYSTDSQSQVLKNVSFTARQNEVTALVGMSGCGKTSILRLISRLYDYDGGRITLGGTDIKKISTKSLFDKVSIVFQEVTLFNASVMENIRLGRPSATDEEVKEAAKLANCQDFIETLPQGYDTLIGENGATLSGGERQRLSIARAFLKNAQIIILDEIAASLDMENEKKIQDSLNKLIENKTVVIISHRLKSVENADKIAVIDDGRVEACGKHKELLTSSKIYKNLVEKARLAEAFEY